MRAVAVGEIVKVRQGVYAAIDAPDGLVHAAEHGGSPACQAAGRMLGLWILDDLDPVVLGGSVRLHLWRGTAGERHRCRRPDCDGALRSHWDEGEVVLGRAPPVRNVLLQIALCAGEESFFAALESALRQHLLPPDGLTWLSTRLPSEMRWLLGFSRTDADSGLESLVRLRLHRLGITVRTQVLIDGVGEVDFLIGDRLIIETDGRGNHDGSLRHKDLLRDAKAAALGYETLRFDYAMIVHDWPTVAAAIVAKIAAGAHLRS